MQVKTYEELSPTKKKLVVQVEPADLKNELEDAFSELSKEVALPGFRKGHVPRKLLEYRFEKAVRKDAFTDAVSKGLEGVFKEKELRVVGVPVIEPSDWQSLSAQASDEPVELSIAFEVIPSFDLPAYKGETFTVEVPTLNEEAAMAEFMEASRERAAFFKTIDDRPIQEGDYLVAECETTRGEESISYFTHPRLMVKNLCRGINPKGFDQGFIGHTKGERIEFDFDIDETHPLYRAEGGNTHHVKARIQQITERQLPELDDEFAKDLGFDGLEKYSEVLRASLQKSHADRIFGLKASKVRDYLRDNTELPIPASVIESEYHILKDREENQRGRGIRPAQEESSTQVDLMYQAEQTAKARQIVYKIAEAESITVSDDEYIDYAADLARDSNTRESLDQFLENLESRGLEPVIKDMILENKVTEWLVNNNEFNVTELGESGAPVDKKEQE